MSLDNDLSSEEVDDDDDFFKIKESSLVVNRWGATSNLQMKYFEKAMCLIAPKASEILPPPKFWRIPEDIIEDT